MCEVRSNDQQQPEDYHSVIRFYTGDLWEMSIVLVFMVVVAEAARRRYFYLDKGVLRLCSKVTGENPCFATLLKSSFGMGVLL